MSQSPLKSLGAKSSAASNQLCWQSTSVPILSWTNSDGECVSNLKFTIINTWRLKWRFVRWCSPLTWSKELFLTHMRWHHPNPARKASSNGASTFPSALSHFSRQLSYWHNFPNVHPQSSLLKFKPIISYLIHHRHTEGIISFPAARLRYLSIYNSNLPITQEHKLLPSWQDFSSWSLPIPVALLCFFQVPSEAQHLQLECSEALSHTPHRKQCCLYPSVIVLFLTH